MSGVEIRQARNTTQPIQPAPAADTDIHYDTLRTSVGASIQPVPADDDVQYGTTETSLGESQCIGENIEEFTQLTCHMYKLRRILQQDGNTPLEPVYCV